MGYLLSDLLQFFASYKIFAVEMRPFHPNAQGQKNPISQHNRGLQLIIIDPLNEGNVVTRPLKKVLQLESLFNHLYLSLFHVYKGSGMIGKLFEAAAINGALDKNLQL